MIIRQALGIEFRQGLDRLPLRYSHDRSCIKSGRIETLNTIKTERYFQMTQGGLPLSQAFSSTILSRRESMLCQ